MQDKPPTYTCVKKAWHKHESELHRFLTHRLPDAHQANDLLQEIFIKAIRQGDGFCSLNSARAWLFEVARNAIADHYRLQRDQVELPDDLTISNDEPATIDSLAACIPRVLSELAESDREAILMCDLQGMKQEEYALLKGISLPGAKSRVQRARKRFQDRLTAACQVQFDERGQVICFVPRPPIN
jgi:RNA polymerase sigma-70 factor, ECF subfamily